MANIDLNNATLEDIVSFSGLSEDKAKALIDYRDEHGGFKNWDEVKNVPGFSQTIVEALKKHVSLGGKKAA